jgi:hypothetical protein
MQTGLPVPGSLLRRCAPSLLGIALFVLAVATYLAHFTHAFAFLMDAMGGYYKDMPFMDIQTELAAMECFRRGIDVYVTNPCEVIGRVHNYSPIWLLGSYLHLDTRATFAVGMGLDLAFLASLALLPPVRTWRGTLVVVAATLSNSTVLAVELANADVLIFTLLLLAGLAALRAAPMRSVAYPLIVSAALLKYYPVVAMVIALRERPARCLLAVTFAVLCLLLFAWLDWTDIMRALHLLPAEQDLYMIGARSLPYGLQSLAPGIYARLPLSAGALQGVLGVVAVSLAILMARSRELAVAFARLTEAERLFLLLGGVVMVGCFFAGQSYRYRAVFLLFTLPAMTTLWFARCGRLTTRLFAITSVCVVFVMWGYYLVAPVRVVAEMLPGPRVVGALVKTLFWLGRELVWWWVISVLLGAILLIVARSETVRRVRGFGARD